jgi:hypothetical protein
MVLLQLSQPGRLALVGWRSWTIIMWRYADVSAKLGAHQAVSERQAFIWVRPDSDFGVQAQLEQGEDHPFPRKPPNLPEGVTHVWVAGSAFSSGALAWFPDRGWWRIPWRRPSDGQCGALGMTAPTGDGWALPEQSELHPA